MRAKNNINKTLKKNLFTSPNPVKNKKEFYELFEFIFPGKEIFLLFLDEENFDQQVYYAEKILLRLSYDSYFSPPTRLLFNILSMETELSIENNKNHLGRDHFVHLVHLYLLGIYTFFYHQVLDENIFVEFRKRRSITDISSKNLSRSVVKDFIVAWRYFVLFHDISYPIEHYLGNKEVASEIKQKFLNPFNNIPKSISKDLSLKGLSRFIAVYKLILNSLEYSFENLVEHSLENIDAIECYDKSTPYYQLEKIYGFDTIRTVYSIFDKENLIPVLFDRNSLHPLLVYFPNTLEHNVSIVKTKHFKNSRTISHYTTNPNAPYNKDSFNSNQYQWVFFLNSSITLPNLVKDIFPDLELLDFDKTTDYIYNLTSSQYSMIVSDHSFKQYCFDIYSVLYKVAGYQKNEEIDIENQFAFKHLSSIISNLSSEIPQRVGDILRDLLIEVFKTNRELDFEQDMVHYPTIGKVLLNYFKFIGKNNAEFAEKIGDKLGKEIIDHYELKNNLEAIRKASKKVFTKKQIKSNIVIDLQEDKLLFDGLLDLTDNSVTSGRNIVKNLNNKCKKIGYNNLYEVLNYKPDYPNVKREIFDHGIYSSTVFLDVLDIYNQLISPFEDKEFNKLITVAIGLDTLSDKQYINYKCNEIFVETCFAILTHNIYPKYVSDLKIKTKLEQSPFSYFAILVDSLQHWDRKYQLNQAYEELPYNSVSRGFNIEILNNKIKISDFDARMNLHKAIDRYKSTLDEYLDKASEYIQLNIGNY